MMEADRQGVSGEEDRRGHGRRVQHPSDTLRHTSISEGGCHEFHVIGLRALSSGPRPWASASKDQGFGSPGNPSPNPVARPF